MQRSANWGDRSFASVEDGANYDGVIKKYIVIRIFPDDKSPFRLTVSRAKLLLKHAAEIKTFVDTYEKPVR